MRSDKFWLAVLLGAIIISAAATLALRQKPANVAYIYQDDELIESLDLSAVAEPYSFSVTSSYGVNVISVEHGRIRISEADCPDRACVRMGWINGGSQPIVCLPNRLIIRLESGSPPDVDAIVG